MNNDVQLDYPFRDPAVPLSPGQLELRKLTYKQIAAEPDLLWMADWERVHFTHAGYAYGDGETLCKTTRCLARWAQFLARGAVYPNGDYAWLASESPSSASIPPVDSDAVQLLGLTQDEYWDGWAPGMTDGLFFTHEADATERMRGLVSGNGCTWSGNCNCTCRTCAKPGPYHCGNHGSGCHMNCDPK